MIKRRVLIIHTALAPYRIDIFNYLDKIFELHIIFLRDNLYSFKFDQSELTSRLDSSFEFLTEGININSSIIYRKDLFYSIRRFKPDIVYTHEFAAISFYVVLNNLNKNYKHVIWTADNVLMLTKSNYFNYLRKKFLLKFVDGLTVYTDDVKKLIEKKFHISSESIGVFPNIQKENSYTNKTSSIKNLTSRHLYKKLENYKVVLFVGRLVKVKNISFLINSFISAQNKGLKAKLLIIGDGPLKVELTSMVKDNQNIILAGPIQGMELKFYYNISDLTILPSLYEPFGAVVNESLICGTPVLCSVNAGAKTLIKSGFNGELFNPNSNIEVLSDLIIYFFKNKNKYGTGFNNESLVIKSFNSYADQWLPKKLK